MDRIVQFAPSAWKAEVMRQLRILEIGQSVTCDDLMKAIGFKGTLAQLQGVVYGAKPLLWDEGVQITREGNSFRRLVPQEGAQRIGRHVKTLGRKARRTVRESQAVDISKLTDEEKRALIANASVAGAVMAAAKSSSIKKVAALVTNNEAIDVGRTLDAFKK